MKARADPILSAYGEPAEEGKLHMPTHITSEKPGFGRLIYCTGDRPGHLYNNLLTYDAGEISTSLMERLSSSAAHAVVRSK
jgi:hypothetical protein